MSGIDDARGEMRAGFAAAMQGATLMAGILNSGGREGREAAAFFARQAREQELHSSRLQTEADKRTQQQQSNDRQAILDGLRGVETLQRIGANQRLSDAKVKEVDERINHNAAENTRKADLDALRADEIKDRTADSARTANARIDVAKEQERIAREDQQRRADDAADRATREDQLLTSRLDAADDRARWGEAKHKAEMAEIYQRMEDKARRWGLTEHLSSSQSATTAAMRTAAAFAAANSTRDWGNSEAQNLADFAEMAAQDGISPEDLVAFVRGERDPEPDPAAATVPPEQQLAENFVTQTHEAHHNTATEPPRQPVKQSRDSLDAAGLTDLVSTDVHPESSGPAPSVEPAITPGHDVGLD